LFETLKLDVCQPRRNVNVRTRLRIPESRAVAIEGETDPYVRSSICTATGPSGLVRCLTPAR